MFRSNLLRKLREAQRRQTAPPSLSPCWDEAAASEAAVQQFIGNAGCLENTGTTKPSPGLQFKDVDYGSWGSAPNPNCHASFGDQGTTVTIGAFGQLLQFSSYLGAGNSGMFSADHDGVAEPYFVTNRAMNLQIMSRQPLQFGSAGHNDQSYGLRLPDLVIRPNVQPQLKWTCWKWPCHEYSLGDFQSHPQLKLTIQWMVHEKAVLQQCLLENCGEEDFKIDVEYCKSIIIRDLDHINAANKFNEGGNRDRNNRPGPKGYSWVCMQKLTDNNTQSRATGSNQSVRDAGVSVVSSVAMDGKVQQFEDSVTPQKWQFIVRGAQSSDHQAQVLEVITAYKMSLFETMNIHWTDAVIPFKEMTVDGFLRANAHLCQLPASLSEVIQDPGLEYEQKEASSHGGPSKAAEDIIPSNPVENDKSDRNKTQSNPLTSPIGIPGSSFPQYHLDFAIRRNLEHILSVCAIQTTPQILDAVGFNSLPDALKEIKPVALTCGDMSGHITCWSASFFAFMFLVEIYKKLHRFQSTPSVTSVLSRVKATCLGHLKWLHLTQQQDSGQRFGPNYWATGRLAISPESSTSWLAKTSLLDTAFQILKVAACMEVWPEDRFAGDLMSQWAPPWLGLMDTLDIRRMCAWPHTKEEGICSFRLDDHVWIWRALKSLERKDHRVWDSMYEQAPISVPIEDLRLEEHRQNHPMPVAGEQMINGRLPTQVSKNDISRLRETYQSGIVKNEILQRFKTENDAATRRMLAVTRSLRETRFVLHARDTAIFYNGTSRQVMSDFLGSEGSMDMELWRETINWQNSLSGNQISTWENSLRYGLFIMMGTRNFAFSQKAPDELVLTATEGLFRSCGPAGMFPGRLDFRTHRPVDELEVLEASRNAYYHASFEILYILLTHASLVRKVYNRPVTQNVGAASSDPDAIRRVENDIHGQSMEVMQKLNLGQTDMIQWPGDREQLEILLRLSDVLLGRSIVNRIDGHRTPAAGRQSAIEPLLVSKKTLPFNELSVSGNIVTIEDEWLFDHPDFFVRDKTLSIREYSEALEALDDTLIASEASSGHVASRRAERAGAQFCIVDVRSRRTLENHTDNRIKSTSGDNDAMLWECLSPIRTIRASKKRLIHFSTLTGKAAAICYAATEESGRSSLLKFFKRHSNYEKFFSDRCNMMENTWETEFHLSHYRIVGKSVTAWPGIPSLQCQPLPAGRGRQIARVSTSFRFKGNWVDRYWTGYLVEYIPPGPTNLDDLPFPSLHSKENCQRKVIEQLYFQVIIERLTMSIDEIWTEVQLALGIRSEKASISIPNYNAYISWSALWQQYEPLLQILEDDLSSTLRTASEWQEREQETNDKPRWTRRDERMYRARITEIRRGIKKQISNLQQLHGNIKSSRELCSSSFDKAREELSFRSEQNIASFTYVTVVFLPLGFAASVFSMNGLPGTSLVVSMVTASIVALAVTVLALMNTKGLANFAQNIATVFEGFTAEAKRSSVLVWDRHGMEDKVTKLNDGELKQTRLHVPLKDANSSDLIFWMRYLSIELPSRSITAACRAIGWPRDIHQDNAEGSGMHQRSSGTPNAVPSTQKLMNLGNQQRAGKHGSYKKIAHVLLGFVAVLVFVPLWFLQMLCFYAWDTLSLLAELLRQAISHVSFTDIDEFESSMVSQLTNPPSRLRPMKRLKDHLQSKREAPKLQG